MTAALTQFRRGPPSHGRPGIDAHATSIANSGQGGYPHHAPDVRSLLKVRAKHAALLTLLLTAYYFFLLLPSTATEPGVIPELLGFLILHSAAFFGGVFVIITFLQLKVAHGRTRWILLFSSMVAWAFVNAFWTALSGPYYDVEQFSRDPEASFWHIAWTKSTYGLLAAWFYENANNAARMTAALRHSELARRSAERWVLELRLGIVQARVEPRVLFDALDEAGRAFRSRPAAAEQLLDDLIGYLRRALPKLRQHECRLGHEVDLALSYARLLRGIECGRLTLEASVESSVDDACFVPAVLQPCVMRSCARP